MTTSACPPACARLSWQRLLITLVIACASRTGWATLGAAPTIPPASVTAAYTVQEILLPSGTRVQEFVTPAGLVFAVAWRGPVLPDLKALLGDYLTIFQRHTDAVRQAGLRGGPVNLVQEGLVVRSSGRMGDFFGHAYVPTLVPAGVNIHDLLG